MKHARLTHDASRVEVEGMCNAAGDKSQQTCGTVKDSGGAFLTFTQLEAYELFSFSGHGSFSDQAPLETGTVMDSQPMSPVS